MQQFYYHASLRIGSRFSLFFAALIWFALPALGQNYDQNVTPNVIFGNGNANGSFTTEVAGGIELGLRGKLRHNPSGQPENTFNSNGDGTYSFVAGAAPTQSSSTAVWSFEWSINTDNVDPVTRTLGTLSYQLGLDSDPSLDASFFVFDPINDANPNFSEVRWDHAMGDNTTPNGGGGNFVASTAAYAGALASLNVAQNSWKPHWFISPFDPTVNATYDIFLKAFDTGVEVASVTIQIIVGTGGMDLDDDMDEVPNSTDNCKSVYNPGQEDFDADGIGNACDPELDYDDAFASLVEKVQNADVPRFLKSFLLGTLERADDALAGNTNSWHRSTLYGDGGRRLASATLATFMFFVRGSGLDEATTQDLIAHAQALVRHLLLGPAPPAKKNGNKSESIPETFVLDGNYPNPFNPATTIRFGLPEMADVSLTIYDLQGRELARPVDGVFDAGWHSAAFDGQDLPSGIYLYRLVTPAQVFTGKMSLLK